MYEIRALMFALIVVAALSTAGYGLYAEFTPRYTAVDNKTFHESAQFNDGMIQQLSTLEIQYVQAPDDQKLALRALMLQQFAAYPEDKLPPDLRNFYDKLKVSQ